MTTEQLHEAGTRAKIDAVLDDYYSMECIRMPNRLDVTNAIMRIIKARYVPKNAKERKK